jgi:hypothetical protein
MPDFVRSAIWSQGASLFRNGMLQLSVNVFPLVPVLNEAKLPLHAMRGFSTARLPRRFAAVAEFALLSADVHAGERLKQRPRRPLGGKKGVCSPGNDDAANFYASSWGQLGGA